MNIKSNPIYKQETLRVYKETRSKLQAILHLKRLSNCETLTEASSALDEWLTEIDPVFILRSILENAVHHGGGDYIINEKWIEKIREVVCNKD